MIMGEEYSSNKRENCYLQQMILCSGFAFQLLLDNRVKISIVQVNSLLLNTFVWS